MSVLTSGARIPGAGQWVAQRECARCHFTAPESEFIACGALGRGDLYFIHRDDAGPDTVLVCVGCASEMGNHDPVAISEAVKALLARGVGFCDEGHVVPSGQLCHECGGGQDNG